VSISGAVLTPPTITAGRHAEPVLACAAAAEPAAAPKGGLIVTTWPQPLSPSRNSSNRARAFLALRWVVTGFAAWLLYRQVSQVDLGQVLATAHWGWIGAATACFGLALGGAALNLVGSSPVRLGLVRTYVVQVAGGFVRLVSPSAVGAAALNARYVQRAGVSIPLAIASVGAAQMIQLGSTLALLALVGPDTVAATIAEMVGGTTAVVVAAPLAGGLLAVGIAAALWPPARVRVTRRLATTAASIRLTRLTTRSAARRLCVAVGGSVLLTLGLVLALTASVAAMGGPLHPVSIGTAFLIGSAVGSVVPTPGGIGTVEAALVTALVASGLAVAVALPAVLVFRALTVWLPVPIGWFAFQVLRRGGYL